MPHYLQKLSVPEIPGVNVALQSLLSYRTVLPNCKGCNCIQRRSDTDTYPSSLTVFQSIRKEMASTRDGPRGTGVKYYLGPPRCCSGARIADYEDGVSVNPSQMRRSSFQDVDSLLKFQIQTGCTCSQISAWEISSEVEVRPHLPRLLPHKQLPVVGAPDKTSLVLAD